MLLQLDVKVFSKHLMVGFIAALLGQMRFVDGGNKNPLLTMYPGRDTWLF